MGARCTVDTTYYTVAYTATAITVMAWVYVTAAPATDGTTFEISNSAGTSNIDVDVTSAMVLETWNTSANTTGATLRAGRWYHVCLTAAGLSSAGSAMVCYLDGRKNIGNTQSAAITSGPGKLWIGQDAALGNFMPAVYSNVKVWSTVLTAQQVLREMRCYAPAMRQGLFGWYPMADAATARLDFSARGNHLTVNGSPISGSEPPGSAYKPPLTWWRRWSRRLLHVASGGGSFTLSVSGSVAAAGAITKQAAKPFAGALTATGTLAKAVAKAFAGSTTGTGALTRQARKPFAGATTLSGATIGKATGKAVSGSVAASGTLTKRTSKSFTGSLTPSGVFSGLKVILLALAGAITAAGALTRQARKSLAGSIAATGTLTKRAAKSFAGAVTGSGAFTGLKVLLLALSGAVTAAGALTRKTSKSFAGAVSAAGSLTKQVAKAFAGASTLAGSLIRQTSKAFAGTATAAGSVIKRAAKGFVAAVSLAGALATSGGTSGAVKATIFRSAVFVSRIFKRT